MSDAIELKGMTWDHSRGYDPMVATSLAYSQIHPNISLVWEKRSLQAFADRPIEEMASQYDLMVIDHPHVGEVAKSGLLAHLDGIGRDQELSQLAKQSAGESHSSYQFNNHQWALAIDAATPVAAYRPDKLQQPPSRWNEVLQLAKNNEVAFALIPINALMTYFGMAKNKGYAIAEGDKLIEKEQSQHILELMREIVTLMDKKCLKLDPIGIYEWMSTDEKAPAYSPFGYGYTNYSRADYRPFALIFADAPGIDSDNPRGTILGGTGIAVSSRSQHKNAAIDYAFYIASAACQKSVFFESGGQPGNAAAWEDPDCNATSKDFFTNTRKTLETAWVRPRYDGYMEFQAIAGDLIHEYLRGETRITATTDKLEKAYQESLL